MLSDESLVNMYHLNFLLKYHHGYSLTELDNMMPWERQAYVDMLSRQVKAENDRKKQQQQQSQYR